MKKFPVALQLYSVRDDLEKDFIGTLKQVKALGYDGVGHPPRAKIRKTFAEACGHNHW